MHVNIRTCHGQMAAVDLDCRTFAYPPALRTWRAVCRRRCYYLIVLDLYPPANSDPFPPQPPLSIVLFPVDPFLVAPFPAQPNVLGRAALAACAPSHACGPIAFAVPADTFVGTGAFLRVGVASPSAFGLGKKPFSVCTILHSNNLDAHLSQLLQGHHLLSGGGISSLFVLVWHRQQGLLYCHINQRRQCLVA